MIKERPYALINDHMIFFDDKEEQIEYFRSEQNHSCMKDAQIAYYEYVKTEYEHYISKLIGLLRIEHFNVWKESNAKKATT